MRVSGLMCERRRKVKLSYSNLCLNKLVYYLTNRKMILLDGIYSYIESVWCRNVIIFITLK